MINRFASALLGIGLRSVIRLAAFSDRRAADPLAGFKLAINTPGAPISASYVPIKKTCKNRADKLLAAVICLSGDGDVLRLDTTASKTAHDTRDTIPAAIIP